MKSRLIILFLVVTVGATDFSEYDEYEDDELGIVHGNPANHSIPSQAFVIIYNELGYMWCSGTLITPNYVLTSGYCLAGASRIQVRLGVNNRTYVEDTVQIIQAKTWTVHENYTRIQNMSHRELYNDVGVIQLSEPATLNDVVQTIKLSTKRPTDGELGGISGWGLISYFKRTQELIVKADVQVISNDECKETFDYIQDYMICTVGTDGGGYCNGDQGAPLIIDDEQVGITSWGDLYCELYKPTIYSRVTNYLGWIMANSDYTE